MRIKLKPLKIKLRKTKVKRAKKYKPTAPKKYKFNSRIA